MPRGGFRKNAGRKSGWGHSETTVIRVPQAFASQILEVARKLDKGETLDFDTDSDSHRIESVIDSGIDLVTESIKHVLSKWRRKADAASPKNADWRKARQILGELEPIIYDGKLSEFVTQSKVAPGQMSLLDQAFECESVTKSVEVVAKEVIASRELKSVSKEKPGSTPKDSVTNSEEWVTTRECWERLGEPCSYETFRKLSFEKLYQLYRVQADPRKKDKGKYNSRWLRLPDSAES